MLRFGKPTVVVKVNPAHTPTATIVTPTVPTVVLNTQPTPSRMVIANSNALPPVTTIPIVPVQATPKAVVITNSNTLSPITPIPTVPLHATPKAVVVKHHHHTPGTQPLHVNFKKHHGHPVHVHHSRTLTPGYHATTHHHGRGPHSGTTVVRHQHIGPNDGHHEVHIKRRLK